MFSRDDLQQLAEYQGQHAVLSLTLDVDPTRRTKDEYRLALRHLLRSVQGRANGDAAVIERFFGSEYDWSGRSGSRGAARLVAGGVRIALTT